MHGPRELIAIQDGARWLAVQRLASSVRELIGHSVGSGAPAHVLAAAAKEIAAVTQTLRKYGRNPDELPWRDNLLSARPYSPVTGVGNPLAPPLVVIPQGEVVTAELVFTLAYEGPPGLVHGGVLALVMDEFLGRALMEAGLWGMTSSLTLRYLRPVPLHRKVAFRGWVGERISERGVMAHGCITLVGDTGAADEQLLEAEGLFVYPRAGPPR